MNERSKLYVASYHESMTHETRCTVKLIIFVRPTPPYRLSRTSNAPIRKLFFSFFFLLNQFLYVLFAISSRPSNNNQPHFKKAYRSDSSKIRTQIFLNGYLKFIQGIYIPRIYSVRSTNLESTDSTTLLGLQSKFAVLAAWESFHKCYPT